MSIAQHGASLEYCVSEKQSTDQVDKSSVVFVDQRTSTPKIDTLKSNVLLFINFVILNEVP